MQNEAGNQSCGDSKTNEKFLQKHKKINMKKLLRQIESQYNDLLAENYRLREQLAEMQTKFSASQHIDTKANEQEAGVPSFTRKMGAFLDNAGTKLKISRPKTFKINDILSKEKFIAAHKDSVLDLVSIDSFVISSSVDATAKVWSLETDSCLVTYRGHKNAVNSSRVCPTDHSYVCSACGDGNIHVWSLKIPLEFSLQLRRETKSIFDNSADELIEQGHIEVGNDKSICLNKPAFEFQGHKGPVSVADWVFDGKNIISASWDRTIGVWDVEKAKSICNFVGHEEEILYVQCHPSQKLFVSASADCNFRLWDLRTLKSPIVTACQAHNADVNSSIFVENYIVTGSSDKSAKVWDIKNMKEPISSLKVSSAITRMSSNSENSLCLPMRNNHLRIWYMGKKMNGPFCSHSMGHLKSIEASCWSESANIKFLYTCSIDGSICKWKVKTPNNTRIRT